jgi:hypothetical protein
MDSYWDLYLAYIDYCVRYNYENDIDPHHYEMEWNHTLPQCIFGDQPFGQYLLLKQHAIASALQTLAFKRQCMCGWHFAYLHPDLLKLSLQYYAPHVSDAAKAAAKVQHAQKILCTKTGFISTPTGISRYQKKRGIDPNNQINITKKPLSDELMEMYANLYKSILEKEKEERDKKIRINRRNNGYITASLRYQCTVTGHISTNMGLSNYQKARGIDTSNRIQLQ